MRNGWQIKKLGEVCEYDRAQGVHRGLPYVGMEQIESNTGRFLGSTDPIVVKSNTFRFTTKHVLYGRLRPYLNKVLTPAFDGHCSTEIFPLLPDPSLSRDFLRYWLASDEIVDRINATCTGARMPRANMDAVLAFPLPVPPLPEQQRIVAILDEAFEAIATAKANTEKNLRNARALFESHLQAVFTQRGEGWVEKPLRDFVDSISTGPFGSLLHKSDYEEGGIPLVNPINIEGDQIIPDDRKAVGRATAKRLANFVLRESDIVIGRRGEIGRCAVIARDQAGWLCGTGCFFIRPSDKTYPHYLTHLLRSQPYRSLLEGASARATMPSISNDDLAGLVVRLPSIAQQRRTLKLLESLSAETQRLESLARLKLAALDALKKSVLHQAFTGQLKGECAYV